MVDFMKGVAFLHDRQHVVVHRDLNPANLMLSDGMKRLKIFDFGMAKVWIHPVLKSTKLPAAAQSACV